MSRTNQPPNQDRAGGQPVARGGRSRHRRGDAGIAAAGGDGIAMTAVGGGLLAVRVRRDHLDPATR